MVPTTRIVYVGRRTKSDTTVHVCRVNAFGLCQHTQPLPPVFANDPTIGTKYDWARLNPNTYHLAYALLTDATNPVFACYNFPFYAQDVLLKLPEDGWTILCRDVDRWANDKEDPQNP